MPKITNKATKKTYSVTKEGMEAVRNNPQTKDLYTYTETVEPEEVTAMKSDNNEPASDNSRKANKSPQPWYLSFYV